eukprot:13705963-Ditylum_brightwellii.AAC.1
MMATIYCYSCVFVSCQSFGTMTLKEPMIVHNWLNSKDEVPLSSISCVQRLSVIMSVSAAFCTGSIHKIKSCCIELRDTAANKRESRISIICGVVIGFLRCLVFGSNLYCSQNVGTAAHVADW